MPIIAMTAHVMKGDRDRCIAAGMDDYVAKPIQAKELRIAISRVMLRFAAVASQELLPVSPAFELEEALARVDNDQELLAELIGLFLADLPRRRAELQMAVTAGDGQRLQNAVHSLKGSMGYLCAKSSYAQALKLETIGSKGQLTSAPGELVLFECELDRLRHELNDWVSQQPATASAT